MASKKKVITVQSKSNFEQLIDEAGPKHVLVEFYAQWCGPCALIGPRLEQLANEYGDRLIIMKIDVDDLEELAVEHDISSMPTFMIFKNKVKLIQFAGSNTDKVESLLEKYCGKPGEAHKPSMAMPRTEVEVGKMAVPSTTSAEKKNLNH